MKMTITPMFNTQEIINSTIKKDWFQFQLRAFALGKRIALYMQHYINNNRKRQGGTGKLAGAMEFEGVTAPGTISWGIGNISLLNTRVPYWYVINYGKTVGGKDFIPGMGKFVPGSFGGNPPDSSKKGIGTEHFTYGAKSGMGIYPGKVRPINYIEATRHQLNKEITLLLARVGRG